MTRPFPVAPQLSQAGRKALTNGRRELELATVAAGHPDDPGPAEPVEQQIAMLEENGLDATVEARLADAREIQREYDVLRRRQAAQQQLAADSAPRPRRLSALEFLQSPRPKRLVDDLLYRDSLARLWGAPGCGKSFAILDIGLRVALGRTWAGRSVDGRSPVFYVMAEGQAVNVARTEAWLSHHNTDPALLEGWFHVYDEPLQLTEAGVAAFLEDVRDLEPGLVILDTKNAMQVGEENSATDAASMRRALDAIRRASGACVLLVDHAGYEGSHARGSTAVRAAMDTEVKVTSDQSTPQVITLEVDRDKAAETGFRRAFELTPVGDAAVLVRPDGFQDALTLNGTATGDVGRWQDTPDNDLPESVRCYEGLGQAAVLDLGRYMACEAAEGVGDPGKVGKSRAEAQTELIKVCGYGKSTVHRAWSALLDAQVITPAARVTSPTGRHVWDPAGTPESGSPTSLPRDPRGTPRGRSTTGSRETPETPAETPLNCGDTP